MNPRRWLSKLLGLKFSGRTLRVKQFANINHFATSLIAAASSLQLKHLIVYYDRSDRQDAYPTRIATDFHISVEFFRKIR